MPFFSIGVTTYNRKELLKQTLISIINQTFTDFEVIVGNDYITCLHQTVKKWLAEDVCDICRFEEAYCFQTKISLKDGLKREMYWYRESQ